MRLWDQVFQEMAGIQYSFPSARRGQPVTRQYDTKCSIQCEQPPTARLYSTYIVEFESSDRPWGYPHRQTTTCSGGCQIDKSCKRSLLCPSSPLPARPRCQSGPRAGGKPLSTPYTRGPVGKKDVAAARKPDPGQARRTLRAAITPTVGYYITTKTSSFVQLS